MPLPTLPGSDFSEGERLCCPSPGLVVTNIVHTANNSLDPGIMAAMIHHWFGGTNSSRSPRSPRSSRSSHSSHSSKSSYDVPPLEQECINRIWQQ
ncbi:hypothetical protein RJZ90_003546 [Blastomyces dermatitidis]